METLCTEYGQIETLCADGRLGKTIQGMCTDVSRRKLSKILTHFEDKRVMRRKTNGLIIIVDARIHNHLVVDVATVLTITPGLVTS